MSELLIAAQAYTLAEGVTNVYLLEGAPGNARNIAVVAPHYLVHGFYIADKNDFALILGRFSNIDNTITELQLIYSSNDDEPVNWRHGQKLVDACALPSDYLAMDNAIDGETRVAMRVTERAALSDVVARPMLLNLFRKKPPGQPYNFLFLQQSLGVMSNPLEVRPVPPVNMNLKFWEHDATGAGGDEVGSTYGWRTPQIGAVSRNWSSGVVTGIQEKTDTALGGQSVFTPLDDAPTGNIAYAFTDWWQRKTGAQVYGQSFSKSAAFITDFMTDSFVSLAPFSFFNAVAAKMLEHIPAAMAALPVGVPKKFDGVIMTQQYTEFVFGISDLAWAENVLYIKEHMLEGALSNFVGSDGPWCNENTPWVMLDIPVGRKLHTTWNGPPLVAEMMGDYGAVYDPPLYKADDGLHANGDTSMDIGEGLAETMYNMRASVGKRASSNRILRQLRNLQQPSGSTIARLADNATMVVASWVYTTSGSQITLPLLTNTGAATNFFRMKKWDILTISQVSDATKFIKFRATALPTNNLANTSFTMPISIIEVGAGGWPAVGQACTYFLDASTQAYSNRPGYFITPAGTFVTPPQKKSVANTPTGNNNQIFNMESAIIAGTTDVKFAGTINVYGIRTDAGATQTETYRSRIDFESQRIAGVCTAQGRETVSLDGSAGGAMAITFTENYTVSSLAGPYGAIALKVNGITGQTWLWITDCEFRKLAL